MSFSVDIANQEQGYDCHYLVAEQIVNEFLSPNAKPSVLITLTALGW